MKYKHIGMTTFSVQQTTRLVATIIFIGTLVGVDVDQGNITEIVSSSVFLLNELIGFVDRYRKGDITWYGKRK